MRTLKEITDAISQLSDSELSELHAWLGTRNEPLEVTDAFEWKIRNSERQMAAGQRPRTRSGPK